MPRNQKGDREVTRNVLSLKEALALNKIIEARYTSSGLDNGAFAASINSSPSERSLFRDDLASGHISTAIKAAGIPSNYGRRSPEEKLTMILRVQKLEEQVAELLKQAKLIK